MVNILRPLSQWAHAQLDFAIKRLADECYQPAGSPYLLKESVDIDTDLQGNRNRSSLIFEITKDDPGTLNVYRMPLEDADRNKDGKLFIGSFASDSVTGSLDQDKRGRMRFVMGKLVVVDPEGPIILNPLVIYSRPVNYDDKEQIDRDIKVSDKVFKIIKRSRAISHNQVEPTLAQMSGKIARRYTSNVTKSFLRRMGINPNRLPRSSRTRRFLKALQS